MTLDITNWSELVLHKKVQSNPQLMCYLHDPSFAPQLHEQLGWLEIYTAYDLN